jgi:monothiol glutaredoxin
MPRAILDEAQIHPAIRETIATNRREIVVAVQAAIAQHDLVVVGMGINPVPKKARKLLNDRGIAFHYMEYGSYLSEWRRRNALKMWTGWPTFPMIFHKGIFIGGAADLEKLLASGEIA